MERDSEFTHFIANVDRYGCEMAFSTHVGPENIRIYSNLVQSKVAVKCPTALLLNDEGEFEAFGNTAIRKYESKNRLLRPENADQYYFFYRFKMCPYEKVGMFNNKASIYCQQGVRNVAVISYACSVIPV